MKTCKRIGIFLLLGVLLVGLLISGCAPVEQTQASTSEPEPDPNAIAFRDLPGVNMDDICEINIYIGDDSEPLRTIGTAKEISIFLSTFEKLRFTSYASTSSFSYDICAFEEASRCIAAETTYRIEVRSDDGATWDIYVAENDRVYYSPRFDIFYISTSETDYIN